MSSNNIKTKPIEILDWNSLVQYTSFLSQGDEKKIKIYLIDDEEDKIRLQSKEEFEGNVQCARDQGSNSLKLLVYREDQLVFEGIHYIEKKIMRFPTDKLEILMKKALAEKWYIPVKQDEALALCLKSAIEFAQINQLETNVYCQRFVQTVLPEAFEKLLNTPSVSNWPQEIQHGIFELLELLIDLIGIRIRSPPVPVGLLKILSLVFNTNSIFSQRHENKSLPSQRTYTLSDEQFLCNDGKKQKFGWLKSILQRFLAQNGVSDLRWLFDSVDETNPSKTSMEFNALLRVFSQCDSLINAQRYREVFAQPIQQVMHFVRREKEVNQLKETLDEILTKFAIPEDVDNPTIGRRKSRIADSCELLTDDLLSLTMNDSELKTIKKQRTDEQIPTPLFSRNHMLDEILSMTDKRSLKRKHRREQQSSTEIHPKKSSTISKIYDRSNPEEILRHFAPIKSKIARLYDDLQLAISVGKVREVLKIEEKLKLLRPYSARFVADENTPDGTILQTNQTFRKGWILFNDGSLPWSDEDIQLINLSDGIEVIQKPVIPVTAPHDKALITVDFRCSNQPGTYESKWILSYRQQTFGPMIWCSIEVRQPDEFSRCESLEKRPTSDSFEENFEVIDVPLPDCFNLSKPFRSQRTSNSFSSASDFVDLIVNEPIAQDRTKVEPMEKLIDMGFVNRPKNQRLLTENNDDLDKVIQLLTIDSTEDPEWFNQRH